MRKPTFIAGLILLSASISICQPGYSQEGLALLHRMQEALGGAEKIAAIHDFEQEVRAQSWDGNTGQPLGEVHKRTRWLHPNYLRLDQVAPGALYILYFDGASGWEILPGGQRIVEVAGGELKSAEKYLRDFVLTTWLAWPPVT